MLLRPVMVKRHIENSMKTCRLILSCLTRICRSWTALHCLEKYVPKANSRLSRLSCVHQNPKKRRLLMHSSREQIIISLNHLHRKHEKKNSVSDTIFKEIGYNPC